jgi:hypothetical protein
MLKVISFKKLYPAIRIKKTVKHKEKQRGERNYSIT